jgi:hypothetical protein
MAAEGAGGARNGGPLLLLLLDTAAPSLLRTSPLKLLLWFNVLLPLLPLLWVMGVDNFMDANVA